MKRWLPVLVLGVAILTPTFAAAETVDEKITKAVAAGTLVVKVQEHTRDACDRTNDITVTSTTDGNVVIRPGDTRFFKIDKNKDGYTRSGGWYWKCGGTPERARIKGSTYIKAVRNERGVTDWYWVQLELKD